MPRLCVIPGDGIGQEVIPVAVDILQAVIPDLQTVEAEAGWSCFQQHGVSVPADTFEKIRDCGAALFGAVSSPSHAVDGYQSAILTMRQQLDLYANIRTVKSWPTISPQPDIDMIIVRENTEGLYSRREKLNDGRAVAERVITRQASKRIASKAVVLAQNLGRQRITIVHKANVLPLSDGLFRDCALEVIGEVKQNGAVIETDELLVDVAALYMVADPGRYDVILTTNLYGDILSDAAAHWGGGLGAVPSLNWGDDYAIAEPVHGSAPDIAGQGIANPIAAVLSAALLVRYVWELPAAAARIETAVNSLLLSKDYLTELAQNTSAIAEELLTQVIA